MIPTIRFSWDHKFVPERKYTSNVTNIPPLHQIQTKCFAQKEFNKLKLCTPRLYKVTEVQSHRVLTNENDIPNRVSIDKGTPVQTSSKEEKRHQYRL